MNKEIRNRKINSFFSYYGWIVVVIFIFAYASWYWVFSFINQIRADERINVFIESYGLKENSYEDDLLDYMKEDGVLEVNFYNYSPLNSKLTDYYDAFGRTSDMLILYERDINDIEDFSTQNVFMEMSGALKDEVFNELDISKYQFFSQNGLDYAIKIFDKDDDTYNNLFKYTEWIEFYQNESDKEDVYLLFNKASLNFGSFNESYLSTHAIKASNYLLKVNER